MKLSIHDRLNRIEEMIRNDPFFSNRSLSSGNGGYIFDYDPEDELIVREFIKNFASRRDYHTPLSKRDLRIEHRRYLHLELFPSIDQE